MRSKSLFILLASIFFMACNNENNSDSDRSEVNKKSERVQIDDREHWQDPYIVINLWSDQLKGKKIMEIGSDDGYWTFKLAHAGAYVTAADFSQNKLDDLMERAEELGLAEMIKPRLITTDDPRLKPSEMDMVWAINIYSSLPDRISFMSKVHQGVREDGQLVIMDWLGQQTEHGPPVSERIPALSAMDEIDKTGFHDVATRSNLLPEMWIMVAQNVPQDPVP